MYRYTLIVAFLLIAACGQAQSPKISLQLDAGTARPWLPREDPYAGSYHKWQGQVGASLGLNMAIKKQLAFSPEAGIEYYGLRHEYSSSKDYRSIVSTLGLFYARVSPGITVKAGSIVSLRAGMSVLASVGSIGQYAVWYYNQTLGQSQLVTYADHFGRIRNPVLFGPELSLGLDFPLADDGGSFGFRLTGFLSMNRVFQSDFSTPFNPQLSRLNLGLRYVLPE